MERTTFYDGLYGLAVADALGVPYEGEKFSAMREKPCTGMVGYGHHDQPAGTWSDDTSMTLCVADSLCKGFDPDDMMRKFSQWKNKHFYTATGVIFDVGRSCRRAIDQYMEGMPADFCGDSSFDGNGNGALMRILPTALYQCQFCPVDDDHLESFLDPIHAASSITHAHAVGLICCGLYSLTLREWLCNTDPKKTLAAISETAFEKAKIVYNRMGNEFADYVNNPEYFVHPVKLAMRAEEDLPTWGYAVNTWNIALWSLLTTDNYRDCVLKAVNLGGDTDTNAAIAGSIAGIIYGKDTIPEEWVNTLLNKPLLDKIAEKFTQKLFKNAQTVTVIDRFDHEFSFLSMKAPTTVELDGICYEDIGAAYYALSVPAKYRKEFIGLRSRRARKVYKAMPHLESDNGSIEKRLYRIVKAKYQQHAEEREKLVRTGSLDIIYDTSGSHDNVLGRCRCSECKEKEYNNLYGKLLMRIRSEFQQHIDMDQSQ